MYIHDIHTFPCIHILEDGDRDRETDRGHLYIPEVVGRA